MDSFSIFIITMFKITLCKSGFGATLRGLRSQFSWDWNNSRLLWFFPHPSPVSVELDLLLPRSPILMEDRLKSSCGIICICLWWTVKARGSVVKAFGSWLSGHESESQQCDVPLSKTLHSTKLHESTQLAKLRCTCNSKGAQPRPVDYPWELR